MEIKKITLKYRKPHTNGLFGLFLHVSNIKRDSFMLYNNSVEFKNSVILTEPNYGILIVYLSTSEHIEYAD